jgi:hypothetical protein
MNRSSTEKRDALMWEAIIPVVLMMNKMIKRKRAKMNFLAPFFFFPRAFGPVTTNPT